MRAPCSAQDGWSTTGPLTQGRTVAHRPPGSIRLGPAPAGTQAPGPAAGRAAHDAQATFPLGVLADERPRRAPRPRRRPVVRTGPRPASTKPACHDGRPSAAPPPTGRVWAAD